MSRRASWWPGVGRGSSVPPGFPDPHPASDPDVTLVDPDADLVPGGHDATAVDPDGRPLRPGEPGAAVVAPATDLDPDLVPGGDDDEPEAAVHPDDLSSTPEPDADFGLHGPSPTPEPDADSEIELAPSADGLGTELDDLDDTLVEAMGDRLDPDAAEDDDLEPAEPVAPTRFGAQPPRSRRRRRSRRGPGQVRQTGRRARGMAAFTGIWPGTSETSAPPGFYADSTDSPETARATGSVTAVGRSRSATTAEPSASPTSPRPPLGLRSVGKVAAAVYAALGDPLVGASEAARARRAARVRAVGSAAAMAVLLVLLIYGIFPVRAYLDQRSATQRATEQLEVISRENQRLAEEAEDLRQPEMVEEIARRDHGLVFPGEESYGVLPPPVPTTTTTTTTTTTLPVLP